MQLEHRTESGAVVLTVDGNIALDSVSEMRAYTKTFLDDTSVENLVINFSQVNFIDSSGIGLIVSIFKTLQQRQARLKLCELSAKNIEVFSMTRLDKIISIYDTEAAALADA